MKSKNLLVLFLGFFLLTNTVLGLPSVSGIDPADDTTKVSPDTILTGYVSEDDRLLVNVTFLNISEGILCSNVSVAVNTSVGCKNFSDLPFYTEYCWYLNVSNDTHSAVSYQCFKTRKRSLYIDIEATVTSFTGLSNLVIDLVDVGLDTFIHVLQRFPHIAIFLLLIGIIIGVLGMVLGIFKSLGGIFGMFKDIFPKRKTRLK